MRKIIVATPHYLKVGHWEFYGYNYLRLIHLTKAWMQLKKKKKKAHGTHIFGEAKV